MSRASRTEVVLLALAMLGSGAFALRLGQDFNFDQAQYHLYLGWSLVDGRLDRDIAPAGIGSYFNPLLQVPTYLGNTRLPPRVFAFVLAAVQGLNAFLVYRLARRVLRGVARETLWAALAGLVAAAGPCAVSLLGTSFGDNLPSILVSASLLLLVAAAEDTDKRWAPRVFVAGLLGGSAAALKLTFLVFALALAAAAVVVAVKRRRVAVLAVFASAGVLGSLLAGGYWGFQLWQRFRNPLFPFANNLFHSPFAGTAPMSDPIYAMRHASDLFTPPLDLALGRTERLMEIAGRDLRHLMIFGLLAVLLAIAVSRSRERKDVPPAAPIVVAAWLTGYFAWASLLHYYRYFAAGEFLAPVAILALLRWLGARRLGLVWAVLAAAILVTTRAGSWGRLRWEPAPLRVAVPPLSGVAPAVVLVDATEASWVLPFFPAETRFLGLHAMTPRLLEEVGRAAARHDGPLYRLTRSGSVSLGVESFGLAETDSCATFRTGGRGRFRLCLLRRVSG